MEVFGCEGVVDRLDRLDAALTLYARSGRRLPVVIVGGSALMLEGLTDPARVTCDIDVLEAPFEAIALMSSLDMNNAVQTFAFKMPSGWRDRLVDLDLDQESIRVLAPSPADLLIMKLVSGRASDLEDIEGALALDPSLDGKVSEVLDNPLELEVNLDEDEWNAVRDRWAEILTSRERGGGESELDRLSEECHRSADGHAGGPMERIRDSDAR